MRVADKLMRAAAWCAIVACVLLVACGKPSADVAKTPLIPGFDKAQADVQSLQLRGAGNKVLVSLHRVGDRWRVAERGDWAADAGRISQYLFVLSQARRMQAKTSDPRLYSRLGVEPVGARAAKSLELTLSGKGRQRRLVIGNEHPRLDGYYVRLDAEPGTWLTDLPVYFDPDPKVWLDHRLADIPLARIAKVAVSDPSGKPFSLSHRDDRFRLDDAPSGAMHDSFQGDAMAGALDHLQFEDVALDDGHADILRRIDFTTVDGMVIQIELVADGERFWIHLKAGQDAAVAGAWALLSEKNIASVAASVAALEPRIAALNEAWVGRRFLLADPLATTLMLDHEQILSGPTKP